MMGLAPKALPCVLPPLELQLPPPPARAHKSFLGCAAQLPLIIASAATLLNGGYCNFSKSDILAHDAIYLMDHCDEVHLRFLFLQVQTAKIILPR